LFELATLFQPSNSFCLSIPGYQYKHDLIIRISSDAVEARDIAECNRWYKTDKANVFRSDHLNTSGCHFILHAMHAGLLQGYHYDYERDERLHW